MKVAGLAMLIALAFAGQASAEAYGLKAARAALSGKSQAVIVAVPAGWTSAKPPVSATDAVAAGDWQFTFNTWLKAHGDRTNVVVVTPAELKRLIVAPAVTGNCATIFVRDAAHAMTFDQGCMLTLSDYKTGDDWLRTGVAPAKAAGFHAVDLKLK